MSRGNKNLCHRREKKDSYGCTVTQSYEQKGRVAMSTQKMIIGLFTPYSACEKVTVFVSVLSFRKLPR